MPVSPLLPRARHRRPSNGPSRRGTRLASAGGLAAALSLALLGGLVAAPATALAAATTYHLDCAGSDSRAGTSPETAWKTLAKASAASLVAGDSLLLRRGCTFEGTLRAKWTGTSSSPVTIGAYGSGAQPLIRQVASDLRESVAITGDWLVLRDLAVSATATGRDSGCQNWPLGYRVGFRFYSGSSNVTLRDSTATGLYFGVKIDQGSSSNKVLGNTLRDNEMRDPNTGSDAGAIAIVLEGDDNEIARNTISGSDACSPFYGRDGAAVEVYGGRRNLVHHNVSIENNTFTELGHSRSADNTFAYNKVISSLAIANVLVTRGTADTKYGPVLGTRFFANTAYLTGSSSYAIQCLKGCNPQVLSMRDNVIWSNDRIGYADAAFDERNNVYWRAGGSPRIYFPISSSSAKADPRFVDAAAGDLRLGSGSPALDAASGAARALGLTTDLDGIAVPQGSGPDIGAHERLVAGTPTPTPAPTPTRTPTPTANPTPNPTPSPTPAPGAGYVSDAFSRTVSSGWGSAPTGGSYRTDGTASGYAVNGSAATIDLAPGQLGAATLGAVGARDVLTSFRVRLDRLPGASGGYAYVSLRGSGSAAVDDEYRLKVRVASSGDVFVHGTRVVDGVETDLGGEAATGTRVAANGWLRVRARVQGTSPTELVVRAWADGAAEPTSWQYRATDATSALADAGHAGLRAYVSSRSTNGTVRFTFDDWTVSAP